jgi:hypothetical protein
MKIRWKIEEDYSMVGEVRGDRIWFPAWDCQIFEGESPLEALVRVVGKCEVEVFS